MKRDWTSLTMLTGLCVVVLASGVRADQEDDKKKAEREWREAEGEQGKKKGEQGPGQGGVPGLGDNPLEKILELMKGVEDRLFESDTGDFTQEEQRKVAEAMRFEDKTSQALEELIRKIEEEMQNQQQQQQQSSGEQSEEQKRRQRQQQEQQKNETPEQKREREERERREKQEEEQRRMQQQQQRPQDQQQPQNDRAERERQERREALPPDQQAEIEARAREAAGRWGQLPAKLHQDAQNALNQEPPARWAELIKRYRERLSTSEDR